jgi:hypothetical protein
VTLPMRRRGSGAGAEAGSVYRPSSIAGGTPGEP